MLEQTIWQSNHASQTKLYFNEFVANVLRDNIGIVFLTSEVMEAFRGQKHTSEAKKGMKELIYGKKYLIKVFQQPQKPLSRSNPSWATTSGKKHTATSEVTVSSYTTIGIIRCTLGVATDDLAVKPYIPHKNLPQWICYKCLAW